MRRFITTFGVIAALAIGVYAETDYVISPVVKDIQNGVNNPNQIKTLRVEGSGTVGGNLTVSGTVTSTGASSSASPITSTAATTATAVFIGADAAGAANTLLDTTGAGTITIGSADVTAITLTTDGTGDGTDVVLPTGAISTGEILDGTIVDADISGSAAIAASKVSMAQFDVSGFTNGTLANARLDADLQVVATNKAVVSLTGSTLNIQYGAATNGETVAFVATFAGTPAITATCYDTNATAWVTLPNATNFVMNHTAADGAQYAYWIAVGVK